MRYVVGHNCVVCRLAYHQRIVEVLPAAYSAIMPPDTQPVCKYGLEVKGKQSHIFS